MFAKSRSFLRFDRQKKDKAEAKNEPGQSDSEEDDDAPQDHRLLEFRFERGRRRLFGRDHTAEYVKKRLEVDKFPQVALAAFDQDQERLAVFTRPARITDTLDLFFGQLLIWDIRDRWGSAAKGFLLTDRIDLKDHKLRRMGFFETRSPEVPGRKTDYLWYLTDDYSMVGARGKREDFVIYSLVDH